MHILNSLLWTLALVAATPTVGDPAPDFTLQDWQGKTVRLSEETGQSRVVLIVLRGFPGYQCPVCNRQVQDFLKQAPAFREAGARVLFVYPGPMDNLNAKAAEFLKDKSLPDHFRLALDPGYEVTQLYGLRWDAPKETAYPSTFILNQAGKVTFAKISRSHGGRTTPEEILAHLKR